MAFISISITKNHPLILGKGGFGRQLADWLSAEGWGEAEFLDDSAPGCVGGLRDYADPKLLKPGRPAFVALGDNALRVELLQKLAAAGYDTPVFISCQPQCCVGAGLCDPAPGLCGCRCASGRGLHHQRRGHRGPRRGPGPRRACCPRRHRKGRCRGGSPNQGGFWGNH